MIEESNRSPWLVLTALLVFHLLLVSLPANDPSLTGSFRAFLMDMLTPAERLVDRSADGVGTLWTDYLALVDTRQENLRLERENDQLTMEIQRNRQAVLEAHRLQRFFALGYPEDAGGVVARVMGGDPSISQQTVTLDKGVSSGLDAGMPVITPDGVVGRILYVSRYAAIVQLLTDPVSAVGAVIETSRVQGIARGNGTRELVFEHSDDSAELQSGDLVLTSGTERIYPRGLPIGVVSSVETVTDLLSTAIVEPLSDLRRLEEVMVLTRPDLSPAGPESPETSIGDDLPLP